MRKLMNFFMLSCKKAGVLLEKRLNEKLSVKEKIQLTMHTSFCNACTAYSKQTVDLEEKLQNSLNETPKSELKLSDEDRSKIIGHIWSE